MEGNSMQVRALLFDIDGTLVDTEELHRQAYNQTFLEFGLDWEWGADLYSELLTVSGGAHRLARYIDLLEILPAEKTHLRRLIPAIHRGKSQLYGELTQRKAVRLRPGVKRLLAEAKQRGARIGFAASSASSGAQALLSSAFGQDAREVADDIVWAEQITRKKPAPDTYELLLTMLRVPAADCVAFEDSANGLASAKAVKLFTIVTPTRWTMAQQFADADLLLPSLGDPDLPLDDVTAARLGAPYLDLAQLETLRATRPAPLKLQKATL
jgi:HAD superfamily hydrolase (TIGR01509 family)